MSGGRRAGMHPGLGLQGESQRRFAVVGSDGLSQRLTQAKACPQRGMGP